MNFVRFTTARGREFDMPVEFPAELDPRFDFVKTDEDLALTARKRIAFAHREMRSEFTDTLAARVVKATVVVFNTDPINLIADPPTVERGV